MVARIDRTASARTARESGSGARTAIEAIAISVAIQTAGLPTARVDSRRIPGALGIQSVCMERGRFWPRVRTTGCRRARTLSCSGSRAITTPCAATATSERRSLRRVALDVSRGKAQARWCHECGTAFRRRKHHRDAAIFCSRTCAFASRAKRKAERLARRAAVGQPREVVCAGCGVGFATLAQRRYCSSACRPRRHVSAIPESLVCLPCGRTFKPVRTGGRWSRLCSAACAKDRKRASLAYRNRKRTEAGRRLRRVEKAARRARQRTTQRQAVDPFKVFERDGWRCQACGCDTPRQLRGLMVPSAPELDHVIPLALDGSHTYDNTQCLCRACNGRKGASLSTPAEAA